MRIRKLLALLLCLSLAFALISCSAPADQGGQPQKEAASKEAGPTILPDYVGFTLHGATFYLENEYKVIKTPHDTQPEDNVYKTEPAAGTEITPDTVITFYVSTGPEQGESSSEAE